MYKYLSIVLASLVLIVSSFYACERYKHSKTRKNLNNQIAKMQTMQKETESAYSRLAIENENLKANTKALQEIIEDRDEEILAKAEAEIKWKNKYFKIKNARQSTEKSDGTVVTEVPAECEELRVRVDFEHEEDPFKIKGFTLSNPAYAEVGFEWTRGLRLDLILTKNRDGTFRVYLDSEKGDIVPADLRLEVDPSILELKWYEKIGVNAALGVGNVGVVSGLGLSYQFGNFNLGPMVFYSVDGENNRTAYGANVLWHPFR